MRENLETINVEFAEQDNIGTITLDRPDNLNAISGQLMADIKDGLSSLEAQNEDADGIALRAVLLEGAGGNFSAGADIDGFGDEQHGETTDRTYLEFIRDFPAPIVAKIEGYCLGGGLELAMSCDFRLAHEDATFGLPEVDLGLIPGGGGVQLVSHVANPSVAMDLAMMGEHRSAEWAHRKGLVDRSFSDADFDSNAQEFVRTLASKPPLAIQAIKKSAQMASEVGLSEGIRYDRELFGPLQNTDDFEEGVRGFADDDYEPEFEGK